MAWESRPERIRRELPLEWAVGTLLGVWAPGNGEPIQCPLPGHADDTPSFNLWKIEERKDHPSYGLPQRFGCFGCGANGDVVDIIRIARGLGFGAACDLADDELIPAFRQSGWTPKRHDPGVRAIATPDDLEALYNRLSKMNEFGDRALERFAQAKADDSGQADFALTGFREYAVAQWDWFGAGPAESGRGAPVVGFPHRDSVGAITGIKFRDPRQAGGRWNHPGSRFPMLYGTWRGTSAPYVLLCEGETDTVWAAYLLKGDPRWDVFGLPSGANQKPTDEQLAALDGRRLIYLAFDGDKPGFDAAQKWYDILVALGRATQVIRLPEGEDVLSSRLSAAALIARGTVPRPPSGTIDVQASVFARATVTTTGRGQNRQTVTTWTPVADFGFTPIRELETDDGPAWDVRFEDTGAEALIRAVDLASMATLTRWAGRYGRSVYGPAVAIPFLLNWLSSRSSYIPLESTSTKVGRIGSTYVWPGGSLGPDRLRYVPPARGDAKLEGRVHLDPGPFDKRAVRALEVLNDEQIMATILGWLTATLLRGRLAPAPALFVSGEAGAGKTVLIDAVLRALGFGGMSWTLSSTTPFAVDCAINSSVGFPVWFDEYRPAAREDSMRRLQQLLRDAYNGQPSMKGGMTQHLTELTEVSTWAGIIVSGEQGTYETSHADRLVMINLDPDRRARKPLEWLQADPNRTAGLGRAFVEFLSTWPLFRPQPHGDPSLPDRYRQTMGFIKTGHEAWRAFRSRLGVPGELADPDWARLWVQRSAAEDPWLEALRYAEGIQTREGHPIVQTVSGVGVHVLPHEVVRAARDAGIDLPAGSRELISWLKRRYPGTEQIARPSGGRRYWSVPGLEL